MKKILSILIIFLTNFCFALKSQPLMNVPNLPQDLENFITDVNKYFDVLVENYLIAKVFAYQLGIPDTVPEISYFYVRNQDLDVIRSYNDLAKVLYRRVIQLEENRYITNLQNILGRVQSELLRLRAENDSLRLLGKIWENCNSARELQDSTISNLISRMNYLERECYSKVMEILNQSKFSSLLAGNIKANQWFFDNARLVNSLSPSFDLELHLLGMAKDVLGIKFSASYNYLTTVVETFETNRILKETYKDDIWNFSAIFYVNLSKILNSRSIYWEIDMFGGYFRGFTKSFSPRNFQNDYKGLSIGTYTLIGGNNDKVPLRVLAGVTFFKFIDEFGYFDLSLGKPFVPSLFIGVQFNVLNKF